MGGDPRPSERGALRSRFDRGGAPLLLCIVSPSILLVESRLTECGWKAPAQGERAGAFRGRLACEEDGLR